SQRQHTLRTTEVEVSRLVKLISERIIARELHMDPRIIGGMVREGLGALAAGDHVTIRVGEFFAEVVPMLEVQVARAGVATTVIVDPALGQYGCRIETEWGVVDESVESRLQAMLESISIAPPPRR
ncbi:MAG: hypothetical protein RJA70_4334, partial [Pseudomonadota bacterium]